MGCGIITGGGPGLMQAANEGAALAGGGHNVGIRVHLPFEQEVNAFVAEAYELQTFFSRLHHFVLASDAFVVVPGGIGTVLELAMIWQLLQVRKLNQTPLILVGRMWAEFVEWGRRYLLRADIPLANSEDFDIPHCVDGASDAIALIRECYQQWLTKVATPSVLSEHSCLRAAARLGHTKMAPNRGSIVCVLRIELLSQLKVL